MAAIPILAPVWLQGSSQTGEGRVEEVQEELVAHLSKATAGAAMALPFCRLLALQYNLPKP